MASDFLPLAHTSQVLGEWARVTVCLVYDAHDWTQGFIHTKQASTPVAEL